jgi:HD-like signal output (HDOD) protein
MTKDSIPFEFPAGTIEKDHKPPNPESIMPQQMPGNITDRPAVPTSPNDQASTANATFTRLCHLPPFNTTAVRALTIAIDGDSAMKELAHLFTADPALAAEILTLANSAEFGFRSRIATIHHAISVLGIERTQALAITISTAGYVRTKLPKDHVRPIWAHAIATGVIAEHLAARSANPTALLYTAGLTHDLGRLGLFATAKESYGPLLSIEFQDLEEAAALETRLVGVTHTEAGAFLTQSWGFPPLLTRCAQNHHNTDEAGAPELQILRTACVLAGTLGYPEIRLQTPLDSGVTLAAAGSEEQLRAKVEQRLLSTV